MLEAVDLVKQLDDQSTHDAGAIEFRRLAPLRPVDGVEHFDEIVLVLFGHLKVSASALSRP
jgi:hypothetical protein